MQDLSVLEGFNLSKPETERKFIPTHIYKKAKHPIYGYDALEELNVDDFEHIGYDRGENSIYLMDVTDKNAVKKLEFKSQSANSYYFANENDLIFVISATTIENGGIVKKDVDIPYGKY